MSQIAKVLRVRLGGCGGGTHLCQAAMLIAKPAAPPYFACLVLGVTPFGQRPK